MRTPVALFLYRRPALTARVFAAVRAARPRRLFLIADGPRAGEAEAVAAARAVCAVDWPCAVERLFAERHLGLRARLSSGLDAVFAAEPEAIVLEDDTLPGADFFPFCESLLARYRHEPRVAQVSGCNPLLRWKAATHLYSRLGSIWGWASWRRAWRLYDVGAASAASEEVARRVAAVVGAEEAGRRRKRTRAAGAGTLDTWDFQWSWARLAAGAVSAVSAVNLVSNIGFGARASHTHGGLGALPRWGWEGPPRAPAELAPDADYDRLLCALLAGRGEASAAHRGRALLAAGRPLAALVLFRSLGAVGRLGQARALLALGRMAAARSCVDARLAEVPGDGEAAALRARLGDPTP